MIEYIQGDIIKSFEKLDNVVLLHQENVISKYKKGFAKVLYDKYPNAYKQVTEDYFGNIVTTKFDENKYIVNFYSQFYPGKPYKKDDKYDDRVVALKECLSNLLYDFYGTNFLNNATIILPLIASGLAKDITKEYTSDLDYFQRYIAPIIEKYLEDYNVKVYYL